MKRSAMKRGTSRMNSVSPNRAKKAQLYEKATKEYLESLQGSSPLCERCDKTPGVELHHLAKRNGCMLWAKDWFAWLCRPCHRWVHDNPREAEVDGWIVRLTPEQERITKTKEEPRLYE